MGPFFWLILVVIIVAMAAVTGLKPMEGRHVARTALMTIARVVLLLVLVALAYAGYRTTAGG